MCYYSDTLLLRLILLFKAEDNDNFQAELSKAAIYVQASICQISVLLWTLIEAELQNIAIDAL